MVGERPEGAARKAEVLRALAALDGGAEQPFGPPTGYELAHGNMRYAPKAAVGRACLYHLGRPLRPLFAGRGRCVFARAGGCRLPVSRLHTSSPCPEGGRGGRRGPPLCGDTAMKKRQWFAPAALGALALALATSGTSPAQPLFGPRYGYGLPVYGGYGWGGYGYGYPGFVGAGYGLPALGYGTTYAPGYGLGYGYPGVLTAPSGYVGYPVYGLPVPAGGAARPAPGVAAYSPASHRWSWAPGVGGPGSVRLPPSGGGADADTAATVQAEVPANATLWFDGVQTQQTGARRTFRTPPLERGRRYHYDVKARWEQDGKPVERTRRVDVAAGARVTVDFNQPNQ
jgi:uncharacterized protein (TIGR03000 family)